MSILVTISCDVLRTYFGNDFENVSCDVSRTCFATILETFFATILDTAFPTPKPLRHRHFFLARENGQRDVFQPMSINDFTWYNNFFAYVFLHEKIVFLIRAGNEAGRCVQTIYDGFCISIPTLNVEANNFVKLVTSSLDAVWSQVKNQMGFSKQHHQLQDRN